MLDTRSLQKYAKYISEEQIEQLIGQSVQDRFQHHLKVLMHGGLYEQLKPFLSTPSLEQQIDLIEEWELAGWVEQDQDQDVDADDPEPVEETTSEQSDEETIQELLDIHNSKEVIVDDGMTAVPLNQLTIFGQKKVFDKFDERKTVTALIEEKGKPALNAPGCFPNEIKVALAEHNTFIRAYKEATEDEDEDGIIQIANDDGTFTSREFMNTMMTERMRGHEPESLVLPDDDQEVIWRGANEPKSLSVNKGMVELLKSAKRVVKKRDHKQRIEKHLQSANTKSKRSRFDGQDVPWLRAYLETGLVPYTAALTAVFKGATDHDLKSVQAQLGITTV